MSDVLIVGGGVVGLTAAYELALAGARITVVDRGESGQEASWAGAGMIPPGGRVSEHTALQHLADHAAVRWPELSCELAEWTGIDNEFHQCGALHFPASAAVGSAAWQQAYDDWHRVPQALVSAHDLPHIAPHIGPQHHRVFSLPTAAQVRNPRHLQALKSACKRQGVAFIEHCEVQGFKTVNDRIQAVRTADTELHADQFLVTAGAWTGPLLAKMDCRIEVEPVRGQIVLLKCPVPPFDTLLEAGPRYLVPRRDGHVLIGSTEEWVGFNKHTTAEGIAELLAFAIDLVPSLATAPVIHSWAGLRPYSRRKLPYVGRLPTCLNLYLAAGHFRAGLSLSPATGRLICELLAGHQVSMPLQELAPTTT